MAEEDLESNSEQLEEGDTSGSADSAVADDHVDDCDPKSLEVYRPRLRFG